MVTSGLLFKLAPTSLTDNLTPSGRLPWIISKKMPANVALRPLICRIKGEALRKGSTRQEVRQASTDSNAAQALCVEGGHPALAC